ncbi:MAG: hypothetical protein HOE90_23435 [Bacteriovoracaceae bacterium]|jgi:hypothetical protein|nr:hypothetical protein [Bacteriovoracaceae bacterium]
MSKYKSFIGHLVLSSIFLLLFSAFLWISPSKEKRSMAFHKNEVSLCSEIEVYNIRQNCVHSFSLKNKSLCKTATGAALSHCMEKQTEIDSMFLTTRQIYTQLFGFLIIGLTACMLFIKAVVKIKGSHRFKRLLK